MPVASEQYRGSSVGIDDLERAGERDGETVRPDNGSPDHGSAESP